MKTRLDVYLVENGLAESREKAKRLIMAGQVYINNQKADKSGDTVKEGDAVEVRGKKLAYVSRGGLKLEKALRVFPIDLVGRVCLDIGASTGGFTDCMLQSGAKRVYAVDVGYGQLAWSLRQDPRVVSMERTNFRYVEALPEAVSFAACDASFISLKLLLPPAYALLKEGGEMVCLIKPQFEAGREKVGKKGVVRDPEVHREVIEDVILFAKETGFLISGLSYSPIRGPEGNIEYLLYLKKTSGESLSPDVLKVVKESHQEHEKEEL